MLTTYTYADGTTETVQMCEHFFCQMPARAYSKGRAAFEVSYTGDRGTTTLKVCSKDMEPLMEMITKYDLPHEVTPL